MIRKLRAIDSHTGGEPTRVIVDGGPDLGAGPLDQRRTLMRDQFDAYRRAAICEPRGSDVLVGAILCPPVDPECAAGVVFFNNVGYLGMCGHGTIGLAVTLGHLGRIAAGRHLLETPVGRVAFDYDGRNSVSLENVPSYRLIAGLEVDVPGLGRFVGDVAWGGNWFFLVREHRETLELANVARLTDVATRIQDALRRSGVRGSDGGEIEHVELFGPPGDPRNHSRNFVLCPGGAYDRSPCGTGTSAKVACLAAAGKLRPGEVWRQESILGSLFEASYGERQGTIVPRVAGQAFVTADSTLWIDDADPLAWGVGP